jgi:hypothetical protein
VEEGKINLVGQVRSVLAQKAHIEGEAATGDLIKQRGDLDIDRAAILKSVRLGGLETLSEDTIVYFTQNVLSRDTYAQDLINKITPQDVWSTLAFHLGHFRLSNPLDYALVHGWWGMIYSCLIFRLESGWDRRWLYKDSVILEAIKESYGVILTTKHRVSYILCERDEDGGIWVYVEYDFGDAIRLDYWDFLERSSICRALPEFKAMLCTSLEHAQDYNEDTFFEYRKPYVKVPVD